jgi:hypothetical protein
MLAITMKRLTADITDLFLLLDTFQMERMMMHDPTQFDWQSLPGNHANSRLGHIVVAWLTTDELKQIQDLADNNRPGWQREALLLVFRGFRFRPELGDHDGPPTELGK